MKSQIEIEEMLIKEKNNQVEMLEKGETLFYPFSRERVTLLEEILELHLVKR